jgi:hypothetical protein
VAVTIRDWRTTPARRKPRGLLITVSRSGIDVCIVRCINNFVVSIFFTCHIAMLYLLNSIVDRLLLYRFQQN